MATPSDHSDCRITNRTILTIDPVPMARTCCGRKVAEADDRAPRKFTQLQAFEAAVRRGSFSAARTELGGSNVSRHVADLENRLARKLLLRSPRGALTRGQVLFGHLTRSFEQIRRLMGVIEAGSLERQSIHLLLHGAQFAPVGPSAKHFRRAVGPLPLITSGSQLVERAWLFVVFHGP